MNEVIVSMNNISKSFPGVKALDHVKFELRSGEVMALLGENGAGKSTLMKILSGVYTRDEGTMEIFGKSYDDLTPKQAQEAGVAIIHQELNMCRHLTVTENMFLGREVKGGLSLNNAKMRKEAKKVLDDLRIDISPDQIVGDLPVSKQQMVEIAKALSINARILIMDEPTAVLTPQEIKKLFRVIRNMKEQGCSVVIITHKLNEVMEISDRVTVLRKGESIGTVNTGEVNVASLIEMMVGKKVDLSIDKKKIAEKTPLLDLDEVTVLDGEGKEALANVSFQLNSHEIVGVAGVANSGQKELCEVIAGLAKAEKGRIFFEGDNLVGKTPRDIIRLGIRMGFIPEDRLGMGLVGSMDIVHNLILKDYQNQPGIVLRRGPCIKKANKIVKDLDIQTPDIYTPVKKLSGGNVQKVLLGREIDSAPKVLITAYAVRGLDIGASYKIYDLLNEQKEKGVGVLFVGEDLDVLMDLCDRIIVLCHGEITGIVDPDEVTKEDIGLLMTGKKAQEVDE